MGKASEDDISVWVTVTHMEGSEEAAGVIEVERITRAGWVATAEVVRRDWLICMCRRRAKKICRAEE